MFKVISVQRNTCLETCPSVLLNTVKIVVFLIQYIMMILAISRCWACCNEEPCWTMFHWQSSGMLCSIYCWSCKQMLHKTRKTRFSLVGGGGVIIESISLPSFSWTSTWLSLLWALLWATHFPQCILLHLSGPYSANLAKYQRGHAETWKHLCFKIGYVAEQTLFSLAIRQIILNYDANATYFLCSIINGTFYWQITWAFSVCEFDTNLKWW